MSSWTFKLTVLMSLLSQVNLTRIALNIDLNGGYQRKYDIENNESILKYVSKFDMDCQKFCPSCCTLCARPFGGTSIKRITFPFSAITVFSFSDYFSFESNLKCSSTLLQILFRPKCCTLGLLVSFSIAVASFHRLDTFIWHFYTCIAEYGSFIVEERNTFGQST